MVYSLLLGLFIYLLNKKIQQGPYDEKDNIKRPKHNEMATIVENK